MVSWRLWLIGALVVPAAAAGCSGKSESDDEKETGARGGSTTAGTTGARGGRAGTTGRGGDTGAAGESGAPAAGGSAGTGARGGTNGAGTSSGGSGLTSGSGGSTPAPIVWNCAPRYYGDGVCHCGCGVPDVDCEDNDDIDECEICNAERSCSWRDCPGKIDPDSTASCSPPPEDWTCPPLYFDDGAICHCGCGVFDPDCEDESVESCEECWGNGSCAGGECPSSIDEDNNSRCDIPDDWACDDKRYKDGTVCDCGCAIVDPDCDSSSRHACDTCQFGCSDEHCPGTIDADDNTICTGVPQRWSCPVRFYADGVLCNCGCNAPDPDCEENDLAACDMCDAEGSCSVQECPGTIDPGELSHCVQPPPPEGWTCPDSTYADGSTCECGCGVADLDCRSGALEACQNCDACGTFSCPGFVDTDDTTRCRPPPEGWECELQAYGDGACHCGCGIVDPDCDSPSKEACELCSPIYGSCANYYCDTIDPADNSRCTDSPPVGWHCDRDIYGDGVCDCGCGVLDSDCRGPERTNCVFCDAEGSCSEAACPGAIDTENNAVCTAR